MPLTLAYLPSSHCVQLMLSLKEVKPAGQLVHVMLSVIV
jgi:hypothetical protein